jgi:predicted transcriptional regulator
VHKFRCLKCNTDLSKYSNVKYLGKIITCDKCKCSYLIEKENEEFKIKVLSESKDISFLLKSVENSFGANFKDDLQKLIRAGVLSKVIVDEERKIYIRLENQLNNNEDKNKLDEFDTIEKVILKLTQTEISIIATIMNTVQKDNRIKSQRKLAEITEKNIKTINLAVQKFREMGLIINVKKNYDYLINIPDYIKEIIKKRNDIE